MRNTWSGFVRPVLALVFLCAALASAQAQRAFSNEDLAAQTIRLEERLKREGPAPTQPPAALKRAAQQALSANDGRRAQAAARAALVADPKDGEAWRLYARAVIATPPKDYSEKYALNELATQLAYGAYERASARPDEAAALRLLGEIYEGRESWRQMLNAYKTSLDLAAEAGLQKKYEELREKYGFRLTDYKIDSDSAAPRVCFQFSEALSRGKVDFTPFIAITGKADPAVTAEGDKLCIDGLRHGERYAVVVRQGVPSGVGEALLRSADYEFYVRDRAPSVRFTGKNYVLPKTGQQGVPVVTVNTAALAIEVDRIGDRNLLPTVRADGFLDQLSGYNARKIATESGQKVWSGVLDVKSELNRDVVTAFPVLEAVKDLQPGVYVMFARPGADKPAVDPSANDYDDGSAASPATQWFVVSDLGLTAFSGADGVHVLVRSLATAAPMPGVEVKLVARNNEVLGALKSDAAGHVRFDPGLARGEGGLAPSLLTVTDGAGDHGFLDMGQTAFDLTDRGVKGRVAPGPIDAFLFTERGVYRSGETVFLTTLLRDAAGQTVSGLPLTLVVTRPDGVEFKRAVVADQGLGGRSWSIPLLSGAATGTWRVAAFTDPKRDSVGSADFLVEDYVPERLEVTLTPKTASVRAGQPVLIEAAARYLYGAVGAKLDVAGDWTVQAAEEVAVPALSGYHIGLDDETFEAQSGELEEHATTDDKGRAMVSVPLPDISVVRPLEAKVTLRVSEDGGRAVSRSVTIPITPRGALLGVKPLFKDSDLVEGGTARFGLVLVDGAGARMARAGVAWTLSRVERRYQWYFTDGRWSYEAVSSARIVADGKVDVGATNAAEIGAAVELGGYRLDVKAPGLETAETSVSFSVGWDGDRTASTPDVLDMTLDKPAYAAGETMQVRLNPRFAGKATLLVVSDKVSAMETVDVAAAGSTATIPVKAEWGSGAYLVALAHRPLDVAAKRMPGRSIGLAWFSVDTATRALEVKLEPPKLTRPRQALDIPVTLAGLAPGEEAYVEVSAVDVGILNLTRYETPKPGEWFFGQKQLATELRDLYGFLIDGMQGVRGAIRSGGDGAARALEGAPPAFEPIARYSGVVKVGADGAARVSFDIPAFNGTLRVSAVGWSKGRTGQAQADVTVRDPVVIAGTLPRFLAIGDRSRFHIDVNNVEGQAGDYVVDLDVRGPVTLPADATHRTLRLAAGQKTALTIPVTAAGVGSARIDLRITGPGIDVGQNFVLNVQPSTGAIARRTVRPLPASGGAVTITSDLLADLVPGTGSVSLSVAPFAALDVPALLASLDRYPYGCTEQTVSRALPLLYVNRLEAAERLALDGSLDERIRDAIDKVLARQGANGSFGLWSVGGDEIWLDAFATDFLTRARERNFIVPQKAFESSLDRLRNAVANASDVSAETSAGLAYATYVLARNGRPVMGDLRYLADTKLDAFTTPLARAQIAAGLAILGDRGRAIVAFRDALGALEKSKDDGLGRPDYGSKLRDGVGVLALLAETRSDPALVQRAGLVVDAARADARYTSTQEQSWMVLAAQALSRESDGLSLVVDGQPRKGAYYATIRARALDEASVTVTNAGAAPARAVVTVSGVPLAPEPAAEQGFKLERAFYTLKGAPVDPAKIRQNDRFVVALKITEASPRYGRLLLVDPLPAGLEIDNPALVDGSGLENLDWLKTDVTAANAEYRDDRFVAAYDRAGGQVASWTAAYIVRAVSPGRYVHPAASIEDMYRPERFGRTAFGAVEITDAR